MISIWVVLIILLVHWVADFVCQTDYQAKNKSVSNKTLTEHVISYTSIWLSVLMGFGITLNLPFRLMWAIPITFVCHWITDYFTSRLNTSLYKTNRIHEFFVSIGFDQVLHYVQLLLTYLLLI